MSLLKKKIVFFLKILSRLPLGLLYLLTDGLYLFIYHIWGFRRELSRSNLRNSFPDKPTLEIERIARASYRNACNMIAEILKGAVISPEELRQRVKIANADILQPYIAAARPLVLLASHHCNWEWLLQDACLELKIPVDAVYKPLRVSVINHFMQETRSRFGGNPIPVGSFMIEVMKRRAAVRIFALVADQTPPHDEEKYWTRFLNQDTAFFVGADKIARIARAPVFFVGMHRVRRGHYEANLQLLAEPPYRDDSYDVIERYARIAENHIQQYPADWLWMYRKWKYKKPLYS